MVVAEYFIALVYQAVNCPAAVGYYPGTQYVVSIRHAALEYKKWLAEVTELFHNDSDSLGVYLAKHGVAFVVQVSHPPAFGFDAADEGHVRFEYIEGHVDPAVDIYAYEIKRALKWLCAFLKAAEWRQLLSLKHVEEDVVKAIAGDACGQPVEWLVFGMCEDNEVICKAHRAPFCIAWIVWYAAAWQRAMISHHPEIFDQIAMYGRGMIPIQVSLQGIYVRFIECEPDVAQVAQL